MHLRPWLLAAFIPSLVFAQQAPRYQGERPPVSTATRASTAPGPAAPQQRLYLPGASIVAPEKAQEIVELFRDAYERLDRPRMVFAVNRQLVEPGAGLQLSGRTERVERTRTEVTSDMAAPTPSGPTPAQTQVNVSIGGAAGSNAVPGQWGPGQSSTVTERTTGDNTYTSTPAAEQTLADRQTVRDIERLFGRPLRVGGARLADQRIVAQLIADEPVDRFLTTTNESARKDREALMRIADVVVEVLISSRPLVVAGLSGDQTYSVPDIQVTAIRLSDGAIIGQAAASDVMGKDRYAGPIVRTFDVNEIAEATALALMEDIALTIP